MGSGDTTILEYRLDPAFNYLSMPLGARVLTVQARADVGIVMWALVHDRRSREQRVFNVVPTGGRFSTVETPDADDQAGEYIGTVQLFGGGSAFHVFEVVDDRTRQPIARGR